MLLLSFALIKDKVLLIPREYIDATQLAERVTDPCEVKKSQKSCNQFTYLGLKGPGFEIIEAESIRDPIIGRPVKPFNDTDVLQMLDFSGMALISPEQVICQN